VRGEIILDKGIANQGKSNTSKYLMFPLGILPVLGIAILISLGFFAFFVAASFAGQPLGNLGTFQKWGKIEVTMPGPSSVGTGTPNPFSIFVDVTFTGPNGKTYIVPGFYNGDDNGNPNGNIWKVRFSADQAGTWSFVSNSPNNTLDGYTGSFTVVAAGTTNPDFYRWGRLEYVGTKTDKVRYLKFRDGPHWLKAGSDDPENFLGKFSNYDTLAKRKNAADYLAGKGVNSLYIMTHNIDGDHQDVWPWLGVTQEEAKQNGGSDARFDIVKLEEWKELFEYMQRSGIVPYLVLEDDSAWSGYDHARYYRELIARFGYLPALIFNFCEEYNERYTLSEAISYMQQLKDIDPYDHPRGIHNVNDPSTTYVDSSVLDFTSIQTNYVNPLLHNQLAINWLQASNTRGKRILMIGFDEPRPELDRKGWWSGYMGGGVWEVHVDGPYDRPMSAWETAWNEIGGARTFMESIPFWEMEPNNTLIRSGTAFCLAKPGETYALYLPAGGTVSVDLAEGNSYDYSWWNPANDKNGSFLNGGKINGGLRIFTAPNGNDWALKIVKSGSADARRPFPPTNLAVH